MLLKILLILISFGESSQLMLPRQDMLFGQLHGKVDMMA